MATILVPWTPSGREILRDYKLADNMRDARHEVQLLRRAGLEMVEMKSVRYAPFFRRRQAKLGYWSGFWGSRIGYDTIFVCQPRRPSRS